MCIVYSWSARVHRTVLPLLPARPVFLPDAPPLPGAPAPPFLLLLLRHAVPPLPFLPLLRQIPPTAHRQARADQQHLVGGLPEGSRGGGEE